MARQTVKVAICFSTSNFKASIFILRSSPYTFTLLAITIIFPVLLAIVGNTLLMQPSFIDHQLSSATFTKLYLRLLYQFAYLLILFMLSLFSATVAVTVIASLSLKPITVAPALSVNSLIFPRLFKSFLSVSAIMIFYYMTFFLWVIALIVLVPTSLHSHLFVFTFLIISVLFLIIYSLISILWHFSSVTYILDSVLHLPKMKGCHGLLRGIMGMAINCVVGYLVVYVAIVEAFRTVHTKGPEEGSAEIQSGPKIVTDLPLVGIMLMITYGGFLLQSIYYCAIKAFFHDGVDNTVGNLDGHLRDSVPLETSIELGNS